MAYIRGSHPQEPRSSEEASEEETESDEALARRLQAEEQGGRWRGLSCWTTSRPGTKTRSSAAARGRGLLRRDRRRRAPTRSEAAARLHAALGRRLGGPARARGLHAPGARRRASGTRR